MSKMKMQAVVMGIESRVVKEGQPDQRTIYDVIDGDGNKWVAWERDLAVKAHAFKGQPAMWEVEQKPASNPKYTNRTLLNIESLGNASMHKALETATAPQPQAAAFDAPGSTMTPKDTSIHRQTAAKCVSWMAAAGGMTPEEFWDNVTDIVTFFESGGTPMVVKQPDFPVAQNWGTDARVPELFNDPGPMDFPPATDEDIPF